MVLIPLLIPQLQQFDNYLIKVMSQTLPKIMSTDFKFTLKVFIIITLYSSLIGIITIIG